MRKKMTSVIAAVLACCVLLTGCKSGEDKETATVTLDKDSVYQSTELTFGTEPQEELQDLCVGEKIMYLSTYEWKELAASDATASDTDAATGTDSEEDMAVYETTFRIYSAGLDGSNVKMLIEDVHSDAQSSEAEDAWYISQMYAGTDDRLYLLYSQYKDEKNCYELRVLDPEGNVTDTIPLDDAVDAEDYIGNVIIDKDENIYLVCEETVIVMDKTGKKVNAAKGEGWNMAACLSPEGQVLVAKSGKEGQIITRLDAQGNTVGDPVNIKTQSFGSNSLLASKNPEYLCYFDDGNDLCGLKEDGSMTKIMNWVSSGLSSQCAYRKCDIGNGEFLILYDDYTEMDSVTSLCRLQKVNPEDVVEKTVVTLGGMYISDEINRQVIKYNKSQEQYQIVLKDYSMEEEPDKRFKADILAGDMPDIMILGSAYADLYASKGLLEDLYPYLEKDPELDKSDFMEKPLSLLETNGKLYRISNYFNVNAVAVRTSDLNGKEQLSLTDLIEMDEAAGDSVRGFMNSTTNKSVLYTACGYNSDYFVNWEEGTCSFDSDEFIALLEYAKTYPNEEDIDYEAMESMPTMVRNNRVIVTETYGITMEELEMYDSLYEGDVTFMGYPTNGNGGISAGFEMSYAISSKSANKDAAWDFLRTLLTREYFNNILYMGTPLRKDCFEDLIRRNSATEKYTDDFGQEIEPLDSGFIYDDYEVQIVPLTDKQVGMYRDIVDRVDREYSYNQEILDIIDEEAAAFFAGQKSASETAEIIQNRATTYINENK